MLPGSLHRLLLWLVSIGESKLFALQLLLHKPSEVGPAEEKEGGREGGIISQQLDHWEPLTMIAEIDMSSFLMPVR